MSVRNHKYRLLKPLFLVLVAAICAAVAFVPRRARADGEISEESRTHFKAGVLYLQDPEGPRYEEAYGEFKRAYELSHSPKVLGNLGLCALMLERDGEAIDAYKRYLAQVPDIEAQERTQIDRDLQALTASAVTVTIRINVPSASITDSRLPIRGVTVTNLYDATFPTTVLMIRPGHHVIRLRVAGKDLSEWDVNPQAGQRTSHDFLVQPNESANGTMPPANKASRAAPIVVMGVGAAALAVGGILGAATLAKVHNLESDCPNNACPSSVYSGDLASARSYVKATDFVILGGSIVTAAGIIWFALTGSQPTESTGPSRVSAACTPTGCNASMRFGFQ
jgi:hypothetical protein